MGHRIALIAVMRRKLDDDNVVGALKPIRDLVAASLGVDDGDESVEFEYSQHRTDGDEGVLVLVTEIL